MIQRILLRAKRLIATLHSKLLGTSEEPDFRCPCCGYAPCDCDDH
jgi:hypothetical protein